MIKGMTVLTALCMSVATSCAAPHSGEPHFDVGRAPGCVLVADLDGDRELDLVVANEKGGDVSVLLADGKGGFAPSRGSPFPAGPSPNDLASGDFNGDGHVDVAVANHETQHLTVLLGDGRGALAPAANSPVTVAVRPHVHGVATGDFNSDGSLDLVTDSWAEDRLVMLFGNGKGSFATPGTSLAVGKHPYQRARVADLNGDARMDIVSPNLEGDNVTILLGDGRGNFRQPAGSPFPCGDSPFNVAIGDVNADGKPDLAIVNSPSSTSDRSGADGLTILVGDGLGAFTKMTGSPFVTGKFPNIPAIGDVNGDGVADVAVSTPDGDRITVFTMSRNGSVASRADISVPGHPKGLVIRDLNRDEKAEILATNNTRDTVTIIPGK
jgi:FG-GAP-like repeat